jgi:hypothetical protein
MYRRFQSQTVITVHLYIIALPVLWEYVGGWWLALSSAIYEPADSNIKNKIIKNWRRSTELETFSFYFADLDVLPRILMFFFSISLLN